MRNFTLFLVSLLITITTKVSAQSYASYPEFSIALKSDRTTKSALISDLLADRAGDLSPIIGSASWVDNGKRQQCRSLLLFDYGILPKMISPGMITKAQLVLIPLQVKNEDDKNETPALRLTVRRILHPWLDSTTTWLNQPLSDKGDEVITKIHRKKKDPVLKIDVTEMVRNMFRFGNNGFLICYSDSLQAAEGSSHWFASAKYANEHLRPVLLISYAVQTRQQLNQSIPELPLTAQDRAELLRMYIRPEPVVTPPASTGTNNNPKSNN